MRTKLRFLEMTRGNMLGYALGPHANDDPIETILAFLTAAGRRCEWAFLRVNGIFWPIMKARAAVWAVYGGARRCGCRLAVRFF